MRISSVVVALVAVLVLGSPAGAGDLGRPGFYLGAGTLGLFEDFDADLFGLDVAADDSWGVRARAGYRANRWLAIEGLFEWYDETDLDLGPFDDIASVDAWTLTANLKLYPLAGRLQPYAIAGAGVLGADFDLPGFAISEDDEVATVRLGAGLDFYANDHFVLNFEGGYYLAEDEFDDLSFFSVGAGLQYRF